LVIKNSQVSHLSPSFLSHCLDQGPNRKEMAFSDGAGWESHEEPINTHGTKEMSRFPIRYISLKSRGKESVLCFHNRIAD
jgi:hypothetical protein